MSFHYIPFQFSGLPRVRCAFQMRPVSGVFGMHTHTKMSDAIRLAGNISFVVEDDFAKVAKSRQSMRAHLGAVKFAELHQIHSDIMVFNPEICAVTGVVEKAKTEADGMATDKRQLALMIKTADCQSILVAHKDGKHIMGLHAGWRGNRMHFPRTAIEKFCEQYKLAAKDLFAVRGPSLGPNMAEFTDFAKDWSEDFKAWYDESNKCMNLWALTKSQLLEAGLFENNIYSLDLCTATLHEQFFSYRKDKNSGRQASVIWIE